MKHVRVQLDSFIDLGEHRRSGLGRDDADNAAVLVDTTTLDQSGGLEVADDARGERRHYVESFGKLTDGEWLGTAEDLDEGLVHKWVEPRLTSRLIDDSQDLAYDVARGRDGLEVGLLASTRPIA